MIVTVRADTISYCFVVLKSSNLSTGPDLRKVSLSYPISIGRERSCLFVTFIIWPCFFRGTGSTIREDCDCIASLLPFIFLASLVSASCHHTV